MIDRIKFGLDLLVRLMNIFPGWKTQVGAVLQVIATLMIAVSYGHIIDIPNEIILLVKGAADVLVGVGAANLMRNNKAG